MTTKEMQQLIEKSAEIRNAIKDAVKECLVKIGHPVYFDWDNNNAPSIASINFDDDLADSYITKIWYDNGLVMVNLHAYYLGEDTENIDLSRECNVDWEDILSYLIELIDDPESEYVPEDDEL